MGARLIALLAMAWCAGATAQVSERHQDEIREREIPRALHAPYPTRIEPDAARFRRAMADRPVVIQRQRMPGLPAIPDVRMFYETGATLRTVVATLARSIGYDFVFLDTRDCYIPVNDKPGARAELDTFVAWLSERVERHIRIFPEARLLMVMERS